MSHLRPLNIIILAVLILLPVSMAHSQSGGVGTTSSGVGKSWNAALDAALKETALNPGWADVSTEPANIAGPPEILDFPDARNDPPISRTDSHTPRAYAGAKTTTATPAAYVDAASPAPTTVPAEPAANKTYTLTASESDSFASSTVEAAPTPLPVISTTLHLVPGKGRLASALVEFARANGWEIAWEIERDFPIDYPATFSGPFLDIITSVVGSLHTTDAPIRAKIYHGNKVVRIIHATR